MTGESGSTASGDAQPQSDEFYVGYLPLPRGQRRALALLVPLLVVGPALAAVLIASKQKNPGAGDWQSDRTVELDGEFVARPYAMLRTMPEDPAGAVQTVLLVSAGKHGAPTALAALHGRRVRVRGTRLQRDGRAMLELIDDGGAVTVIDAASGASPARIPPRHSESLGTVTLRGEIIDPKCYLGAMKPGGGKTHKACATLCIRGGIPPMFVTRDAAGSETFFLITDARGEAVREAIVPLIGEPVEISGELERWDDLLVLRIDGGGPRRL